MKFYLDLQSEQYPFSRTPVASLDEAVREFERLLVATQVATLTDGFERTVGITMRKEENEKHKS